MEGGEHWYWRNETAWASWHEWRGCDLKKQCLISDRTASISTSCFVLLACRFIMFMKLYFLALSAILSKKIKNKKKKAFSLEKHVVSLFLLGRGGFVWYYCNYLGQKCIILCCFFLFWLPVIPPKTCISPPKIALYSPKTSVPELTLKINNGCNA